MKLVQAIFLILFSLSSYSDECPNGDQGLNNKDLFTYEVSDWSSVKAGNRPRAWDKEYILYPKLEFRGLTLYGGGISYGDPDEIFTPLNFTNEPKKMTAWFFSSDKNLGKINLVFWYRNEKCHIKAHTKMEYNKALKVQPSAAGDAASGAP
jgi:hypothetical protein